MSDKKLGLGLFKHTEEITIEELKSIFPNKKNTINKDTAYLISEAANDPEFNGHTLISTMRMYKGIMDKYSLTLKQYLDVIKFTALMEGGGDISVVDIYCRVFGDRQFVKDRIGKSTTSKEYKELTSASSRFRKHPAITELCTQADVPLYLLFQGARYQAVGVLTNEMSTAPYSKDRISAAKAILEHVKPPENLKIELDVGVKESSAVQSLQDQLASLASSQLTHLESGTTDLGKLGSLNPVDEDEDIIEGEVSDS